MPWTPSSSGTRTQRSRSCNTTPARFVNLSSVLKTYGAYYASAQAVADPGKRAALEDLTRRIVRANAWVDNNKADWSGQVAQLSNLPTEAARRAANRSDSQLAPIDQTIDGAWQDEVNYFLSLGQISAGYAVNQRVAPGFDAIIADELRKLGGA